MDSYLKLLAIADGLGRWLISTIRQSQDSGNIKAGSPFGPCIIPALVIVAQLVVWAILIRYGYEKPYWAEWRITLVVSLIVLGMVLLVFYGKGKNSSKFVAFMSTVTWILVLLYRVICSYYTFSIDYPEQSWLLMPGAITLMLCVAAVAIELILTDPSQTH